VISLTIDGRAVQVEPGTLILNAARQAGIEIPVFCYHPRLAPVGACRMCLVRVDKMPKLVPACTTPVAEGMVVRTDTDDALQSHEGVMDFLLSTHPLDCPICDAGGECELQDNAMRYGSNQSRFAEPKRHLKKATELGPMVELDQERCILCLRCIRFMREEAGDPALTLHDRGNDTVVDVAEGRTFDSIFAGNTVQICPVGALTSRPYRFKARPWDLDMVDSICPHCPVGCHMSLSLRHGDVLRIQSRDSDDVNWAWLCDRGRFGYGFVHQGPRLTRPLARRDGQLVPVDWPEAIAALRKGLAGTAGALGGARISLEAQYLLRRWLREGVGTDHVDHRVQPLTAAIPPGQVGRIDDIDQADLIVALEVELLQEAPVLAIRLRHSVEAGHKLVSISRRKGMLDMPHEEIETEDVARALLDLVRGGGELGETFLHAGKVLILWNGRGREIGDAIAEAHRRRPGDTYAMVVGSLGNSYGAEAAGLVPGPSGLDTRGMLEAAAQGELDGLLVVAQDRRDFPDQELLRAALSRVPFLAVAGFLQSDLTAQADVVLPLAAWVEADGHFVNMEGRAQRYFAGASRPGEVWEDWRLFAHLLDYDWDYDHVLEAVRRDLPDLFAADRRTGGPSPQGGYAAPPGVIVGASIFHKGVMPDPLVQAIVPPPRVFLAPDRAEALALPEGHILDLGPGKAEVGISPELPAGSVMWRIGLEGAGHAVDRLAAGPGLVGKVK
jgi:NADH-quinone oxidoreductase subunit G